MITTQVYHLALPLADDSERRWKPYRMFNGATPIIEELSCHASVLSPGFTPHPPHSHEEEELLIALQGEADLIISDGPSTDYARTERLSPGSFIYYPAGQYHTIRNSGVSPISYLMFKWRGDALTGGHAGGNPHFPLRQRPYGKLKGVPGIPHRRAIDCLPRKAACAFNNHATRCRLHAACRCPRCGHHGDQSRPSTRTLIPAMSGLASK